MALFYSRSGVEKLLSEYPWLWAINPTWSTDSVIKVTEADIAILCDLPLAGERWWVKGTMFPSLWRVREAQLDMQVQVARSLMYAHPVGTHIDHVVCHSGDLENLAAFRLYRFPKKSGFKDLHNMVCLCGQQGDRHKIEQRLAGR